jgi:hypothetical protein
MLRRPFVLTYQPPRVFSVSKNDWPGGVYVTGLGSAYGYTSWTIVSSDPEGPGTA